MVFLVSETERVERFGVFTGKSFDVDGSAIVFTSAGMFFRRKGSKRSKLRLEP